MWRWGVGSDDCVVPATLLSVTHLAWLIVLLPILVTSLSYSAHSSESLTSSNSSESLTSSNSSDLESFETVSPDIEVRGQNRVFWIWCLSSRAITSCCWSSISVCIPSHLCLRSSSSWSASEAPWSTLSPGATSGLWSMSDKVSSPGSCSFSSTRQRWNGEFIEFLLINWFNECCWILLFEQFWGRVRSSNRPIHRIEEHLTVCLVIFCTWRALTVLSW